MVIIAKRSGQLGNRLFVFAHFIANSIEYGYELSNPSFYGYAHYFSSLQEDFFCRYPPKKTFLKPHKTLQEAYCKLLLKLVTLCNNLPFIKCSIPVLDISKMNYQGEYFDMSSPEFHHPATTHKTLLITDGWLFRDLKNVAKHSEQIRSFFRPAEKYERNVSGVVSAAREECDLLVGVHIRQGDYIRWLNGKYHFRTEEYVTLMKRFSNSLGTKRVKFMICSNVSQNLQAFDGLNYIMGSNHQLEDMYAFAQCDYLIGPPSTYTMWASFYGSVPLFTVNSIDEKISPESFHISDLNQKL